MIDKCAVTYSSLDNRRIASVLAASVEVGPLWSGGRRGEGRQSRLRLRQPGLRAHLSIALQHRGGGLVERRRRAADRHARYFRNVVVDVDRPDEAVAAGQLRQLHATDTKVFALDDVVPAGRLVRPCRAAGVGHGWPR